MVSTTSPGIHAVESGLATDNLRHEHEAALRVLKLLDRAVTCLKHGQNINPFFFEEVVDFLQLFVVCAHHAKEEEILFPYLLEKGVRVENAPVETIHREHEEEHRLIGELERGFYIYKTGDPAGQAYLIDTAARLTHIARRHIFKENTLFMTADEMLTPAAQAELWESFGQLERRKLYQGTAERLKELVNELERQAFHW